MLESHGHIVCPHYQFNPTLCLYLFYYSINRPKKNVLSSLHTCNISKLILILKIPFSGVKKVILQSGVFRTITR